MQDQELSHKKLRLARNTLQVSYEDNTFFFDLTKLIPEPFKEVAMMSKLMDPERYIEDGTLLSYVRNDSQFCIEPMLQAGLYTATNHKISVLEI